MSTPKEITAGLNAEWEISGGDYPASGGWTLSYVLVKTGAQIVFDAAAAGDDFQVTLNAATTSGYAAGIYKYKAFASKGTDKYPVESGTIEILPDFITQSSGYDSRSHVKRVLDAIEATIEGSASSAQKSMSLNGVNLDQYELPQLLELRSLYKSEYASEIKAEKLNRGEKIGGKVFVRFI